MLYNYLTDLHGLQITFILSDSSDKKFEGFRTNYNKSKFRIVKVNSLNFFGFEYLQIPHTIIKENDVFINVISFKGLLNLMHILTCRKNGVKFVFWGHSRNFQSSSFISILKDKIKIYGLKISDGVLAYTDKEKSRFVKDHKLKESKVFSLNNTVDTIKIKQLQKDYNRGAIKSNLKVINICHLGRLHELRKTETSIKAVTEINLKEENKYRLHIIGEGSEYKFLKRKYSENQNIIFYGAIEDENKIAEIMLGIDFCINAGLIGLNLIHAMAYGKTNVVISSKYHSPEFDYLIDGENGILANDYPEFVSSIIELSKNSALLKKLNQNSYTISMKKYSIKAMCLNFKNAIKCIQET